MRNQRYLSQPKSHFNHLQFRSNTEKNTFTLKAMAGLAIFIPPIDLETVATLPPMKNVVLARKSSKNRLLSPRLPDLNHPVLQLAFFYQLVFPYKLFRPLQ